MKFWSPREKRIQADGSKDSKQECMTDQSIRPISILPTHTHSPSSRTSRQVIGSILNFLTEGSPSLLDSVSFAFGMYLAKRLCQDTSVPRSSEFHCHCFNVIPKDR